MIGVAFKGIDMRRKIILAAVSLLALSMAAPALAQRAETLSPGGAVEGQIDAGDSTAPDDAYRYDDYLIRARADQRLEAVMRADDFDAYLEVFYQGDSDAIASDDDHSAKLVFSCREQQRAYGGTVWKALEAAVQLAAEGIEAEVVDLRVLRPLDDAAIMDSVRRTHRALIVDEGWRAGSLSAEVAMRIVEEAFFELDAPIRRVCSREVPIPYAAHLEQAALPQPEAIAAAARGLVRPKR
jgi:hypothetical protein